MNQLTAVAEGFLEKLADTLDVPETRYASSIRSYNSIGAWLNRPESALALLGTNVYSQGSFRLGTVIRPVLGGEVYDLDIVCEVKTGKSQTSQHDLKQLVGSELQSYAAAHNMESPEEGQYCWTLSYSDEARFSVDVLPSLPDGINQRLLLEARRLSADLVDSAIGITNRHHTNYRAIADEWPVSNPTGFFKWFMSRMQLIFEARRRALALQEGTTDIQKIPEHRVKTPLQRAVQILKHHRNVFFLGEPESRPTSILITTLAAHAYQQETSIADALFGILRTIDQYIESREGRAWVPNPSDPRENFADRWAEEPELRTAFDEWLQVARSDFDRAANSHSSEELVEVLAPNLGKTLVEKVTGRQLPPLAKRVLQLFSAASHKQKPAWPLRVNQKVEIASTRVSRNGFRPQSFKSDSEALPKGCSLVFSAATDTPPPYEVFWQVVNTGEEASQANGLRGGFDHGQVDRGRLQRRESTLYAGSHSIECFIVKNGLCVGQSGPFVVNIR